MCPKGVKLSDLVISRLVVVPLYITTTLFSLERERERERVSSSRDRGVLDSSRSGELSYTLQNDPKTLRRPIISPSWAKWRVIGVSGNKRIVVIWHVNGDVRFHVIERDTLPSGASGMTTVDGRGGARKDAS